MSKLAATVPDLVPVGPDYPSREAIANQLRSTLASPSFHGSKRCQQFLEYVCDRALAGDAGALKERAVAIEVFGRHPDSGLGEDTIVRVGAREVRKRLAQYYASPDGHVAPVVIELPLGSYVPEFRLAPPKQVALTTAVVTEPVAVIPEELKPGTPARPVRWGVLAFAAICGIVILVGALKWSSPDARNQAFDAFWAPVMKASNPLLIGVGHPIVYMPSHRVMKLNEQRLPPTPYPMQRPLALAAKELDGNDIVAVENQFVGFGDMVAGNDVSQMLARRGHNVRLLLASSIPFADLRRSPVYLIGSLSNRWTNELSQSWRFHFVFTEDHLR